MAGRDQTNGPIIACFGNTFGTTFGASLRYRIITPAKSYMRQAGYVSSARSRRKVGGGHLQVGG